MDASPILLDIPQGVVTFTTAIFAAIVLVAVTFGTLIFRFLFTLQGRLSEIKTSMGNLEAASVPSRVTALEPKVELLWHFFRHGQIPNLAGVPAPGNPMKQERWDELVKKLDMEQLSEDEAKELYAALLERREQAIQEKDTATLLILGAGIAFTEWQLKEKELREE